MSNNPDSWVVKSAWDDRKRPRELTVSIRPHFWTLAKRDRKQSYGELQETMDCWIAELETQMRHYLKEPEV